MNGMRKFQQNHHQPSPHCIEWRETKNMVEWRMRNLWTDKIGLKSHWKWMFGRRFCLIQFYLIPKTCDVRTKSKPEEKMDGKNEKKGQQLKIKRTAHFHLFLSAIAWSHGLSFATLLLSVRCFTCKFLDCFFFSSFSYLEKITF